METGQNQPHELNGKILQLLVDALALADQAGLLMAGARIAHVIDDLRRAETEARQSPEGSKTPPHWLRPTT
jgi:hypothetical protein